MSKGVRVFFHIRTRERLIEDPDGQKFASLAEAHEEAVQAARELMANDLRVGRPFDERTFEIRDGTGTLLGLLPFKSAIPRD